MGEVRGVDPGLVPHGPDGVGQVGLVTLAADEDAAVLDVPLAVLADALAVPELQELAPGVVLDVGLVGTVETLQAHQQPGHAPFQETDAHVGVLVEDAVEDDAAEGDHLPEGMAQRMDRGVRMQVVHAQVLVRTAVDAQATAQPVGLLVDGPVVLVTQMELDSRGRQHGAAHPQFLHRPAQFLHRLVRLLQRDQRHGLESRALVDVVLGDPVVVGPRQVDGPVLAHHLAVGQAHGGIEDGPVDAHVLQELHPAFEAHLLERALRELVGVGGMQVVQRRKRVGPAHLLLHRLGKAAGDGLHVLHHVTVAVDDLVLVRHG